MMEQLLVIHVACYEPVAVKGREKEVVMVPFDGQAEGPCFSGKVIGSGVDTQTTVNGNATLSARYMLEGRDAEGNPCRIFIENQGSMETGLHPIIVTDSPLLREWEKSELLSTLEPTSDGVTVKIFRMIG